ncbi:MAG: hypothetical protein PHO89_05430 [Methylacidiphilaceae bacterium]|nr:hypothetical protein [Candidatus Methylacidiphilaceae bacterium]
MESEAGRSLEQLESFDQTSPSVRSLAKRAHWLAAGTSRTFALSPSAPMLRKKKRRDEAGGSRESLLAPLSGSLALADATVWLHSRP